jgi:hypothetical protein
LLHDSQPDGAVDVVIAFVETIRMLSRSESLKRRGTWASVGANRRDEEIGGMFDQRAVPTDFAIWKSS